MVEQYDIVIRNARTRKSPDKPVDIAILNGRIEEMGEVHGKGEIEIDANGGLVTESFVDPHLHMCKVYTFLMIGEESIRLYHERSMGGAMTAIELAARVKEKYHESWIYENVKKAALEGLKYGCTAIRAFVDTDTKARLEGIKALLRVRDELKDVMDIQVVAFPQDGVIKDPGADEYCRKALEMGADVVGGIPWIEYTDEDSQRHIDIMFEMAKQFDKDVAMLTDDAGDPGLRTTEMLAKKAIREGWKGRVTACHARAMAMYPDPYFRKLVALLRMADMSIISDPHTGPLYARIDDLMSSGVNVALGQDDIADAYYPYGRNHMLEVAFLVSHLTWHTKLGDMETLYDMITGNAAKAMRLEGYGLREGCQANLVVFGRKSVYEVLWYQELPRYVISKGKLVAENQVVSKLHI